MGPDSPVVDYSVQVSHLERNEIVAKLKSFGPLVNVGFNKEALRKSLVPIPNNKKQTISI